MLGSAVTYLKKKPTCSISTPLTTKCKIIDIPIKSQSSKMTVKIDNKNKTELKAFCK